MKQRHSIDLMKKNGVSGVGVERDDGGNYFIAIHLCTSDPALLAALPSELDGCPTKLVPSGPFKKLSRRSTMSDKWDL